MNEYKRETLEQLGVMFDLSNKEYHEMEREVLSWRIKSSYTTDISRQDRLTVKGLSFSTMVSLLRDKILALGYTIKDLEEQQFPLEWCRDKTIYGVEVTNKFKTISTPTVYRIDGIQRLSIFSKDQFKKGYRKSFIGFTRITDPEWELLEDITDEEYDLLRVESFLKLFNSRLEPSEVLAKVYDSIKDTKVCMDFIKECASLGINENINTIKTDNFLRQELCKIIINRDNLEDTIGNYKVLLSMIDLCLKENQEDYLRYRSIKKHYAD